MASPKGIRTPVIAVKGRDREISSLRMNGLEYASRRYQPFFVTTALPDFSLENSPLACASGGPPGGTRRAVAAHCGKRWEERSGDGVDGLACQLVARKPTRPVFRPTCHRADQPAGGRQGDLVGDGSEGLAHPLPTDSRAVSAAGRGRERVRAASPVAIPSCF